MAREKKVHTRMKSGHHSKHGFTLLEVILALALSILVLAAITSAVYLHLNVLDRSRGRIEKARLARAILQMMSNDIRSAVQYKPVDMSDLEAMMSGIDLSSMLASQAGQSALDEFTGGDGTGDLAGMAGDMLGGGADMDTDSLNSESGFAQDIADADAVPDEPGVYGNSTELLIDTSRLPRKDQYNPALAQTVQITDIPSDIKTVAYYLVSDGEDAPVTGIESLDTGRGLARREVSRAVARYAQDGGGGLSGLGRTQVVAAEVGAIQFSYFDGTEWLDEWDSASSGTLPLAIEITIALVDPDDEETGALVDISQADPEDVYRLVVHLPIAEPPEEEEETDDSAAADDANSDSAGAEN